MRFRAAWALLALAALGAASNVGCSSSSRFVTVHVEAGADIASVVQLHLQVALGDTIRTFARPESPTSALAFPKTLSIEFASAAMGDVAIELTGVDAAGNEIASGRGVTTLPRGSDVTITLGEGPLPDIAGMMNTDAGVDRDLSEPPPDLCHDGIKDGNELAIDCGGDCTLKCPGQGCAIDGECVTASCGGGFCQLAVGPPSWKVQPSMTHVRQLFACTTGGDGKLYAIGGNDSGGAGGGGIAAVESLTPGAANWVGEPALPSARAFHSAFTVAGVPYSCGGVTNASTYLPDLVALEGGSWVAKTPASGGLSGGVMIAGGDGKFYLPTGSGHVYDSSTQMWSGIATMPDPRYAYAGARGADGKLYAIGGVVEPAGTISALVNAFSIATGTWSSGTALPLGHAYAAAVAAPDGRLYVIGGSTPSDTESSDVFVQRPTENRWLAVPSLVNKRTGACAALAADGRIFVMGGEAADVSLATVESYGPQLTLGLASGGVNVAVPVSGTNFAANATLSVAFDGVLRRTVAMTSATGDFASSFVVPSDAVAGKHTITVVDSRAQYPVTMSFTVTP